METNSKPKLALLMSNLGGGGIQRAMINLARGFTAKGIETHLLVLSAQGALAGNVPEEIALFDLNVKSTLRALPKLVRYISRYRPQTILSAAPNINVAAIIACKLGQKRTRAVVSERNDPAQYYAKLAAQRRYKMNPILERFFYRWADGIVAVSSGVADGMSQIVGIPRNKINVIYNPIVDEVLLRRARKPVRHPWLGDLEIPLLLAVGRLTVQKDFATLLRAFALLRERKPARLIILGEGEERDELESLIQKLDISNDVQMPGFVENPFAYMSKARLFVLSSAWEGLPNVLVEAMACGTPVVSTDCPSGPAEILEGGIFGRLVPPGDARALAVAIEDTLNDPLPADVLKRRAQRFSLERSLQNYRKILEI